MDLPTKLALERMADSALDNPGAYTWSYQGFGFIRCYLTDDQSVRLHIWDREMGVEEVSTIHDHPWHFESLIISGTMHNQRWRDEGVAASDRRAERFWTTTIRPGEGGGPLDASHKEPWWLSAAPRETYGPGEWYAQRADELHESFPERGCMTIIRRERVGSDVARVFWREGEWIDAEPRSLREGELEHFLKIAGVR